ncbi:hypothetical protein LCGC14_2365380, partial [marine sediment metagenome]
DTGGNVYVAGYSSDWGSPVNAYAGDIYDAFAAKLNSTGALVWNTFMGGTAEDRGEAIVVDTDTPPNVYVAGQTGTTWGSPVTGGAHAGGWDAFAAKTTDPLPQINIKQDTSDIPDGGSYDFESKKIGTDTDVIFTIENTGNANLTLTTSITIAGTNADQFSVQQEPSSPVTGDGSTTFDIRFSPTALGAKTASISIANNDSDENPYDIDFTGTGKYELTITAGTGGTTDPTAAAYLYNGGAEVGIEAIPDSGYRFWKWTGDASGTANPVTVTMDSHKSVTANFTEIATKFVILNPADSTAGTATTVTVQAQRPDNSVDTFYDDDVTLVASGSATGEGLVNISSGVGTLSINDTVAETVNLSLSGGDGLDISSTQNVLFSPGTATQFVILNPADSTAGTATTVTVQAQDANNNVDTAYNTDVTLVASGSATGEGLVTITSGVGTLDINDTVAETVNLSLSDTESTGLTFSSTQDVVFSPAGASKFVILNPADSTAGTATTVTVQAQDANNNVDTAYNNDVTLVADGSATGAGLVNISSGVGTLAINDTV